ncbi:MAG: ATP-dependent DNA helicase [Candidatus Woesearchaeota archaeon]
MDKKFLFPHERVREIQEDLVKDADEAIRNRKHLIAHAPTGLGKTAATLGPALRHAIDENLTVFFLTSRHTQHQIAVQTLEEIRKKHSINFNVADIIGKRWMCSMPGVEALYSKDFAEYCKSVREDNKCEFFTRTKKNSKLTPEAAKILEEIKSNGCCHTERLVEIAKHNKLCPYEMATALAADSRVVVADYFYIFNSMIRDSFLAKTNKELGKSIIIIDEGHNLPVRTRDLATERISNMALRRAINEAKKYGYDELVNHLSLIQDILNEYANDTSGNERLITKEDFMKRINRIKDYEELTADLDFAGDDIREQQQKSQVAGVAKFLDSWKGADESFARIFSVHNYGRQPVLTLSYRCLDPSTVTKEIIEQSYSTIIMSGTLNPTRMYRDLLGFPAGTIERTYESPFMDDNKLSIIVPETTTKYSMRNDSQFKRIAEICSEIINEVPGNSAIFFPSYSLRDQVYRFFDPLCRKTVMLEQQKLSKSDKSEILEKFKSYQKTGAVMLGVTTGSFGEGIDLPGDLLKCVVVAGLPLQQPDLETKELINYYDRKFAKGWDYGYIFPAFNRTLQNAGRCIRSENDRGVVVFLDQRYIWPNYKRCFPKGWDINVTRHYREMIEEFFEPTQRRLA